MKIAFSRSAVLTAIAIAILLSALPGAIRRVIQTGDPYLFTRRFFEDIWARLSGPGRLRFILPPTTAVVCDVIVCLGHGGWKTRLTERISPFSFRVGVPTDAATRFVAKCNRLPPRAGGYRDNPGRHFPDPHLPEGSSGRGLAAGPCVDCHALFPIQAFYKPNCQQA